MVYRVKLEQPVEIRSLSGEIYIPISISIVGVKTWTFEMDIHLGHSARHLQKSCAHLHLHDCFVKM